MSFIVGTGGPFTPAPSFFVLASDKPDEPLCARSMTTVWEAVIERVRQARAGAFSGTTAVSGPPYFGLANPGVGWHFGLGMGGRGVGRASNAARRTPRGPTSGSTTTTLRHSCRSGGHRP